jgi:putative DeoR family transcriptional regulator (stage III sporulation protein D)
MRLSDVMQHVYDRAVSVGWYILESNATIRKAASVFKVSKTTIHEDVRRRLPLIDTWLAQQVGRVIDAHKSGRYTKAEGK